MSGALSDYNTALLTALRAANYAAKLEGAALIDVRADGLGHPGQIGGFSYLVSNHLRHQAAPNRELSSQAAFGATQTAAIQRPAPQRKSDS